MSRCFGDGDPLYERYHDEEWGRPVTDERGLFERMSLEAFQSGLSWLTILRKRENFRAAFANFEPEARRALRRRRRRAPDGRRRDRPQPREDRGDDRERPRHGRPPRGRRHAARADLGARPAPRDAPPQTFADVPSQTPETVALAKELKRRGFRFVGPTTLYALMQATGVVDDHLAGCPVPRRAVTARNFVRQGMTRARRMGRVPALAPGEERWRARPAPAGLS